MHSRAPTIMKKPEIAVFPEPNYKLLTFVTKKKSLEIGSFFLTLYICKYFIRIKNMLMFCPSKDENTSCAKLLGLTTKQENEGGLICQTTSLLAPVISDGGLDTCSFYSGPSDATIYAFGESSESCGSVAYSESGESCGSIAFSSGSESCGSVASSAGSFSGGCSYSC